MSHFHENKTETSINATNGSPWWEGGFEITPITERRHGMSGQEETPLFISASGSVVYESDLGERTQSHSETLKDSFFSWMTSGKVVEFFSHRDHQVESINEFDLEQSVIEQEELRRTDDISENRIVLLARKYADNKFSPEESARLEILNEMIQRLTPSVTELDMDKMNDLSARLDRIAALKAELRQKYGLEKD